MMFQGANLYCLNDAAIDEACLDLVVNLTEVQVDKIRCFCVIGEQRFEKFHDFIEAMEGIREHQLGTSEEIRACVLQLMMIQGCIDNFEPVSLDV
jgi:hypothetical protein